jgi:hypothetical protein
MESVRELHPRHMVGEVAWQAAIGLGIGDDDTAGCVAESVHASLAAATAWVEQTLPEAEFPDWVRDRPHGVAGAFLYGSVTQGWYDNTLAFEPDPDLPVWDADLIDGVLRWREQ